MIAIAISPAVSPTLLFLSAIAQNNTEYHSRDTFSKRSDSSAQLSSAFKCVEWAFTLLSFPEAALSWGIKFMSYLKGILESMGNSSDSLDKSSVFKFVSFYFVFETVTM